MITTIIFLIVLAVLIFVHELGHFLFAKVFGIRVDAFKIGFGPKIFSFRPKGANGATGETEYGLNLIPFGGYVKIFGESPEDETAGPASTPAFVEAERSRSLAHKPRWQQAIVLIGGIFFNIVFAWLLYVGLFAYGVTATADSFPEYASHYTDQRIMITDVMADSPAQKAGIRAGDVITQVYKPASVKSSSPVRTNESQTISVEAGDLTISEIQRVINDNDGSEIVLSYVRNGQTEQVRIMPTAALNIATTTDATSQRYIIGIAMNDVADMRLPLHLAVWEGGRYAIEMLKETAVGLYGFAVQAFQGKADLNAVTGPVGIAGIVGDAARLGLTYLFMITALISINLAVINVIPFPALDGGRLLFIVIESIIRRPLPAKAAMWANAVGFSLLMILMVFVTYRDIVKLFIQ